jgi:photosystem II stability/assembly factor-like uncharacterized protein
MLLASARLAFPAGLGEWRLTEFQPAIPNGGRANTIAAHPTDAHRYIVASETGGLFASADGGLTWHHVDTFSPFTPSAVAFVPADPSIVIATTSDDFSTSGNGGVWRSTDGGASWAQVAIVRPPSIPADRLSAFEISFAPDTGDVFIGSTWGVLISHDRGASWTVSRVFTSSYPPFRSAVSVLAMPSGLILAGGSLGLKRSTDGGLTWTDPLTGPGSFEDLHAFARSPFRSDQAYAVTNNAGRLSVTEDGGNTWSAIGSAAAGGGGCGGIAFVKTRGHIFFGPPPFHLLRRSIDLYFGNRCSTAKLVSRQIAGTSRFSYSGSWTPLNADHGDTRDLAFNPSGVPSLLASDGGLHATSDGGANWAFVGGGRAGYNALQITEVKGQWIDDIARYDRYFGTQDNDLWSSSDDGATWQRGPRWEGFFIEVWNRVAHAANSIVTYVACADCSNGQSDALFANITGWSNPPGTLAGNPKIIGINSHVQAVAADSGMARGYARTDDRGGTWTSFASLPEELRDLPKLARTPRLRFLPSRLVLYEAIRTGWYASGDFEINKLARMTQRPRSLSASVTYPAMTNFGGLGIMPTMFAWYQVFAVAPKKPNLLIAPDVINQKMMRSETGGEIWQEIPGLTALVTDSGRLFFNVSIFPQVSAVSFSPDDPNLVAIGTRQNGIFMSGDGGLTWEKVPGSEVATLITSLTWRSATDLTISTYGRGLWRLKWELNLHIPDLVGLCEWPCDIRALHPEWVFDPPYEQIGKAYLVLNGHLNGAEFRRGRLAKAYVSPGGTLVSAAKQPRPLGVEVAEAEQWMGLRDAPADLLRIDFEEASLSGLIVDQKDKVSALVESPVALTMTTLNEQRSAREQFEKLEMAASQKSPTADAPYIELQKKKKDRKERAGFPNAYAPGEEIIIKARNMGTFDTLELLVDGNVVDKIRPDKRSELETEFSAPPDFGIHKIEFRDTRSGRIIDGTMFAVGHSDEEEEESGEEDKDKKEEQ